MPARAPHTFVRAPVDPRDSTRWTGALGVVLMGLLALGSSLVLFPRLGTQGFVFALGGILIGLIYLFVSFRSLAVPLYLTVLAIGGFRFIISIQAPLLPDLYLDRIMIIWLLIVFMVKFVAEKRKPKGPYGLDILLLVHGVYLFIRIWMDGFVVFNPYSRSIIEPYLVYFFAKNIVTSMKQVRVLFALLLVLGFYYSMTSIAQKFHLDFLLYPTYMRANTTEFVGRSIGPFLNPAVFGTVMGMILPINLYFLTQTQNIVMRGALFVNLSLGFAGLYFTYTRGPWLSTAVGLAAVILLNFRSYVKPLIPALMVVPIVAIAFLGAGQDKFMKERVEEEGTIGARLGTAVTALRVWRDNPLIGCGYFKYRAVRVNYVEPVDVPGFETIRFIQYRDNPLHDMILGPLAEDGIIGFGLMLASYVMIGRALWKRFSRRRQGDHFGAFVIPLFVGIFANYLVGGLTISYRYFAVMGTMLFLAVGITAGFPEADEREEAGS